MSNADIVDLQLEAYNNLDVEKLLETYSTEIEFREFGSNQLILKGHDEIRKHHLEELFSDNLHAEISNRISIGNLIIDHEIVTGLKEGYATDTICIYQLCDGLIEKIWTKNF